MISIEERGLLPIKLIIEVEEFLMNGLIQQIK